MNEWMYTCMYVPGLPPPQLLLTLPRVVSRSSEALPCVIPLPTGQTHTRHPFCNTAPIFISPPVLMLLLAALSTQMSEVSGSGGPLSPQGTPYPSFPRNTGQTLTQALSRSTGQSSCPCLQASALCGTGPGEGPPAVLTACFPHPRPQSPKL